MVHRRALLCGPAVPAGVDPVQVVAAGAGEVPADDVGFVVVARTRRLKVRRMPNAERAPGAPSPELIRIVSRSSPMALAQVERVRAELAMLRPGVVTEVVPVTTSGDRWMGDLSALGGKGAFTKEVDAALLAGEADL